MSSTDFPSSWSDPRYVATVVSILAIGALVFYSSMTSSGLTVEEVVFVGVVISLPTTIAYEIARRWE